MGYTRIQIRRDPAGAWEEANPVLADGELGLESDACRMKAGDGIRSWNELPYLTGGVGFPDNVDWGDVVGEIGSNEVLLNALNNHQTRVERGKADGYTPLDEDACVPDAHLPATIERAANRGVPRGYAPLGDDGLLPSAYLQDGVERTENRGMPGGYAALGNDAKLLEVNLPTVIERTSNKGVPGGYPPIGKDRKIPVEYLPAAALSGGVGADIPRGVIVMWSGAIADIPDGWALCDGQKGTPNLLDRFIVCVESAEKNPGATGGTHSQRLSEAHIPAHTHAAEVTCHVHAGAGEGEEDGGGGYEPKADAPLSVSTQAVSISSTGNGASFDNRPGFFALAMIMKL